MEQVSEVESGMSGMSALLDQTFFKTVVNMLGNSMKNIYSMKEQMGNVSREMEILRKNYKEMLGIKNTNRNEESL